MNNRARQRQAIEQALRRRRGASKAHSEKVKQNMLGKEDLYTTCKGCGKQIQGTLEDITTHMEGCHDGTC